MAYDRIVNFKDKKPTLEQLKIMLEDFFGGAATLDYSKEEEQKTLYVILPGKPSFPFRRLEPGLTSHQELLDETKDRWIEICFVSLDREPRTITEPETYTLWPNVDVMTRIADEYTNVLASGFATMIARYFQAELNE